MPLTITFPVFFYAHTLGKTFREISPAHTDLHKQRQEDWEKEHNHQHGALKQEMAPRTRTVRKRTNERILPSSLPQRRHSGEQMPSVKYFGEWSHFLCNSLLWITILITGYWSLQVLKVQGKWQHEETKRSPLWDNNRLCRDQKSYSSRDICCVNWNNFKFSTLMFYWPSHRSCWVCFYT